MIISLTVLMKVMNLTVVGYELSWKYYIIFTNILQVIISGVFKQN